MFISVYCHSNAWNAPDRNRVGAVQDRTSDGRTKTHVCVLEDDAAVRDSLRWMLERNGFSSRTFSSPNEFLMSRTLDRYDCLIVDPGLPRISGLELLELLRARDCATPAASELRLKPIAPATLLAAVRNAISHVSGPTQPITYVTGRT